MNAKSWGSLLSLLMLSAFSYAQQSNYSSVKITPEEPKAGETLTVNYEPVDKAFQAAKSVEARYYVYRGKDFIVKTYPLEKKGKVWTGSWPVDTSDIAILLAFHSGSSIDNNDKKGYSFLVFGEAGKPLAASYDALSGFFRSQARAIGINPDQKKVDFYKSKYFETVDTAGFSFIQKMQYLDFKKDTAKLLQLITSAPLRENITNGDYAQAGAMAKGLNQSHLSELLTNLSKKKSNDPRVQKMEVLDKLMRSRKPAEVEAVVTEFKTKFPNYKTEDAVHDTYLNDVLAQSYTYDGQYDRALELIKNNGGTRGARSHMLIAMLIDNKNEKEYEDKAINAIEKSFVLLNEEQKLQKERPAYKTPEEYVAQIETTKTQYGSLYASLLTKKGLYASALPYQQKAVDAKNRENVKDNALYTFLLEKNNSKSLQKELEGFVKSGHYTAAMKEQLKKVYMFSKPVSGFDPYFAELEKVIKETRLAKVKKEMINEKAPDFELLDMAGNTVSLASLKGKTVVLDFWATWCGPCIASFPAMYSAQEKMKAAGKNVEFLFVNTWEREVKDKKKNVEDFMKDKSYKFRVLLDNESKVVADYKVTGIPTKFIIGPDGQIKFKAVGFGGNDEETVQEVEMMIDLSAGN